MCKLDRAQYPEMRRSTAAFLFFNFWNCPLLNRQHGSIWCAYTTDGKTIRIFYQGVEIQKHDLTNKQFNYDLHDKHAILKSDLMEDKTDEEINQYMLNNLSIYDQIGE